MKNNYIQNQFVTYEIALKLKQLGFNEKCIAYFMNKDNLIIQNEIDMSFMLQAPLWQQVIDWFREKYDIDVEIHASFGNGGWWWANLCYNPTRTEVLNIKKFENYYEAREQAILKAIELCQKEDIIKHFQNND